MGKSMHLTPLGKAAIMIVILAALYALYSVLGPRLGLRILGGSPPTDNVAGTSAVGPAAAPGQPTDVSSTTQAPGQPMSASSTSQAPVPGAPVTIGIAYGTEKERWLKAAVEEWAKTPDGQRIRVELIPMGSVEGAQAILADDTSITVWSPASGLYAPVFEQEWQVRHGESPFHQQDRLALSPVVFVMWEERYQAFRVHFGEVSFETVGQALAEPGGWATIADRPEWGLFKLGHTHPNQSNSGLATLVLMAYDFHDKSRDLTMADILDVDFQNWMQAFERGVSGMANSTGNMMREMVLKGPSSFDALVVYENVAIDYLANAEGRWGKLRVVYPPLNLWNDNPYYVLDAPWVTPEQQAAAGQFLSFLLTEPIQRMALPHGFRPGNPAVPIKYPDSPFERLVPYGLQVDLTTIVDAPPAEVITNLLASWQRGQGTR